jgi:magnesium-transporting ATPase (P-type)
MIIAAIAVCVGLVFFGIAIALGMPPDNGFLLAVGVTVALVPEGLLPTVTLSLARGAQQMARRNALVRKLESVETLGSTTFICTDKTGTLTRNEMAVVRIDAGRCRTGDRHRVFTRRHRDRQPCRGPAVRRTPRPGGRICGGCGRARSSIGSMPRSGAQAMVPGRR